jgi:hypothetical protein
MVFDVTSKSKSKDGRSLTKQTRGTAAAATDAMADTMAEAKPAIEQTASIAPQARVDHWFDRQLNTLYGEVADEPVPDEILALIDKLKSPH